MKDASARLFMWLLVILLDVCFVKSQDKLITAEERFHVYDPDVSSLFYINDHTFIMSTDWHIIGITHTNPADPTFEVNLGHASTNNITVLNTNNMNNPNLFQQKPFILGAKTPETHLWAPHILDVTNYYSFNNNYCNKNNENNNNQTHCYIMVYCGGGYNRSQSIIAAAYSTNLYHWKRIGILFTDGVDARDPMLFYDTNTDLWHLYYCGTRPNDETDNNVSHVVLLRYIHPFFLQILFGISFCLLILFIHVFKLNIV